MNTVYSLGGYFDDTDGNSTCTFLQRSSDKAELLRAIEQHVSHIMNNGHIVFETLEKPITKEHLKSWSDGDVICIGPNMNDVPRLRYTIYQLP